MTREDIFFYGFVILSFIFILFCFGVLCYGRRYRRIVIQEFINKEEMHKKALESKSRLRFENNIKENLIREETEHKEKLEKQIKELENRIEKDEKIRKENERKERLIKIRTTRTEKKLLNDQTNKSKYLAQGKLPSDLSQITSLDLISKVNWGVFGSQCCLKIILRTKYDLPTYQKLYRIMLENPLSELFVTFSCELTTQLSSGFLKNHKHSTEIATLITQSSNHSCIQIIDKEFIKQHIQRQLQLITNSDVEKILTQ